MCVQKGNKSQTENDNSDAQVTREIHHNHITLEFNNTFFPFLPFLDVERVLLLNRKQTALLVM